MNTLVATQLKTVEVSSPARLHLGFLDLNGSLGRKFGSFGLAIDSHHTTIQISYNDSFEISGVYQQTSDKIKHISDRFFDTLGKHIPSHKIKINVKQTTPSHVGFGSGTQLSLVVGTALCKYYGISIATTDLAEVLGRGKRSGIGIASFEQGGFIIDGGNKANTNKPPVLVQHAFPDNWRVILILDHSHQGIHGEQELAAFKALPTFPQSNAEKICHLTLMQLLPSLIENDIDLFGQAITDIQAIVGDHFAPAQGGRYTSKAVEALLLESQLLGFTGIAQSSWGPTGCIFAASEQTAAELVEYLQQKIKTSGRNQHDLEILIAKGNNTGAIIDIANL